MSIRAFGHMEPGYRDQSFVSPVRVPRFEVIWNCGVGSPFTSHFAVVARVRIHWADSSPAHAWFQLLQGQPRRHKVLAALSHAHVHADYWSLRTTAPIMSKPRMLMMRFTVLHHFAFCHRLSSRETSDATTLFGYAWLPYSDICAELGTASGFAYSEGRLGRGRNAAIIHT
jgi:hypothetical protein